MVLTAQTRVRPEKGSMAVAFFKRAPQWSRLVQALEMLPMPYGLLFCLHPMEIVSKQHSLLLTLNRFQFRV